jgi:hypothetical protein
MLPKGLVKRKKADRAAASFRPHKNSWAQVLLYKISDISRPDHMGAYSRGDLGLAFWTSSICWRRGTFVVSVGSGGVMPEAGNIRFFPCFVFQYINECKIVPSIWVNMTEFFYLIVLLGAKTS